MNNVNTTEERIQNFGRRIEYLKRLEKARKEGKSTIFSMAHRMLQVTSTWEQHGTRS